MGESTLTPAVHRYIERLVLTEFRSYRHLTLATDGRAVVLVGPNGAGKTNLLEALSLLSPGRGLRRARVEDLQYQGTALGHLRPWAVAARLHSANGPCDLGTGRDPERIANPTQAERRLIRIDGIAARSQTALGERLSLLWLTPQMDGLFREGASARRRFLDRLVYGIDSAHVSRIAAYEKALRERSRLLKDGRRSGAWLDGLEAEIAAQAVTIAAARRLLVARLATAEAAAPANIFPRADLALDGVVEAALAAVPPSTAEADFRTALGQTRRRDAESGSTQTGPHRTDLAVTHRAKGIAAGWCSTGEQKALLIAILLANARLQTALRGEPPLLLLDEVTAHLDAERRSALFDAIEQIGGQAWLTGTDDALFAAYGGRACRFHVADGSIIPQAGA